MTYPDTLPLIDPFTIEVAKLTGLRAGLDPASGEVIIPLSSTGSTAGYVGLVSESGTPERWQMSLSYFHDLSHPGRLPYVLDSSSDPDGDWAAPAEHAATIAAHMYVSGRELV